MEQVYKTQLLQQKEIDEQSKQSGFYQEELDQAARQGYANAKFELEGEEGLDVVDEFYHRDEQEQPPQTDALNTNVASLQKKLAQSVRAVN